MTQEEMRQQKAYLLLEYQEVEDQLRHLEEAAKVQGELITTFGNWLQHAPATSIIKQGQPHHGIAMGGYMAEKYATALNAEKAFELADKIRMAQAKLAELKERKERLGVR